MPDPGPPPDRRRRDRHHHGERVGGRRAGGRRHRRRADRQPGRRPGEGGRAGAHRRARPCAGGRRRRGERRRSWPARRSRRAPRSSVLVELDVGLHRAGVRGIEPAVELGAHVARRPGLRLAGLLGYEGHCMLEPDRALRISKAQAANDLLIAAADAFDRRAGCAPTIVAGGGLGTWDITGANPRITEIHAGTYVFMDAFHARLVPGFEVALTVLGDGHVAVRRHGRAGLRPQGVRPRPRPARDRRRRGRGALRARRALRPRGAPRARPARGLTGRGGRPHRARARATPPPR